MQQQTRLFWDRLSQYEVFISTMVIVELNNTKDTALRQQLLTLVASFTELDSTLPEMQSLAQEYLKRGIFTPRFANDAVHVATATIHQVDFLVSWNFQHLADCKRIVEINATNSSLGYNSILIVPPPML